MKFNIFVLLMCVGGNTMYQVFTKINICLVNYYMLFN